MVTSVETLRRRLKKLNEKTSEYGVWMHGIYYYEVGDPRNQWTDDDGVMHIAVPARLTERGRLAGVPYTEIVYDISKRHNSNDTTNN